MADKQTVYGTGSVGRIHGAKGSEAGKTAKYDAMAENEERQRYRAAHGASGIAGARKAAAPEFKSKEDAHIKKWRASRATKKAKPQDIVWDVETDVTAPVRPAPELRAAE